jgi:4a-hydroxytetrahydrobiopterin dehydratase
MTVTTGHTMPLPGAPGRRGAGDSPFAPCHAEGVSRRLDLDEITRQLADLPGWIGDTATLNRAYDFPDFPTAVRCVDEVALVAEAMNHHPDIDIRWRTVRFALSTHDAGGVTQLDVELAHRIRELSTRVGGV